MLAHGCETSIRTFRLLRCVVFRAESHSNLSRNSRCASGIARAQNDVDNGPSGEASGPFHVPAIIKHFSAHGADASQHAQPTRAVKGAFADINTILGGGTYGAGFDGPMIASTRTDSGRRHDGANPHSFRDVQNQSEPERAVGSNQTLI